MDYFAGLDISMDETQVCVLDREGVVVHESKTASMAEAIAGELAKAPRCRRIVFETGRMALILFHGLIQLGLRWSASKAGRPIRLDEQRGRTRRRPPRLGRATETIYPRTAALAEREP
jgi:hypothetical protein